MITMLNMDCMEYMKSLPDKAFSLAIVDPPYGSCGNDDWDKKEKGRFGGIFAKYEVKRTDGSWSKKYQCEKDITHWDVAPNQEYFEELFRVAESQIIWGGNYFILPPSNNFIIWQKLTISETFSMAMAEYAWTNIKGNAKIFAYAPQGKKNDARFHPTQKPVALYKWLLSKYAKAGDTILDTHGGSGSICIACHDLGYDLTWMELDKDYYDQACDRYKNHAMQESLFDVKELQAQCVSKDLFND